MNSRPMSNIDKQAQKELYAKVEQQAHSLRGSPREYQALTGFCPVNVIEMHAQKIQALLDELEAKDRRIVELTDKPIGWTDEQELRDVEKLGCGYLFNANPITPHADPRRVILLYAAAAGKGEAS